MLFIETYGKEIFSLFVPILTWALNSWFKSKAKLKVALPHQFTFLVQQPLISADGTEIARTQTARTSSFIITNPGREPATKLEVVFNWKPMCHNIWPSRHYSENIEPDDRFILTFDNLAPSEVIGIELFSVNADLPSLLVVRSAECVAQNVDMYPQPVVRRSTRIIATTLMALGLATAVYLVILLLQFLILQTPLGH